MNKPKPKKKWILFAVILAVVILAVFFGLRGAAKGSFKEESAKVRDLTTYYSYDGNISPADSQKVLSTSTMAVKTFNVKVGDMVQEGDILCVLDNAALQNSVDSAAASLEIAKINYQSAIGPSRDSKLLEAETMYKNAVAAKEQAEALAETGTVSEKDLQDARDAAEAAAKSLETTKFSLEASAATSAEQVKQAEAQKANLEQQLEDTFVKAEVSGEVVEIHVSENESVTMGTPILDIINYDTLEVEIKIDEYDLNAVTEGKEAEVYISALDKTVPGTVTKIAKEATVESGVSYFLTTVTLSEGAGLRVGMTVEVKVLKADAKDAVTITMKALQFTDDNEPFVYVRNGKKIEQKFVSIGVNDGVFVEITEGLSPDDVVLIPVVMMMSPMGMPVEE